jgi:hypothetical protein
MMALIILVILLTSIQTQPETTRVTKNINAPTISKDKDSDTTATKAASNVDLNLVTAKEPYESLFRTTDNVGKTVLIKLRVEEIREITNSNSKFTVIIGWPVKQNNGKLKRGINDYATGNSGYVSLVALSSAWPNVSKGDDVEVAGIVAHISDRSEDYTPAMKQLPEKTLTQMLVATASARSVHAVGAVILVPNP